MQTLFQFVYLASNNINSLVSHSHSFNSHNYFNNKISFESVIFKNLRMFEDK